jgi:hypothetical protein
MSKETHVKECTVTCESLKCLRAVLVLRSCQLCAVVDTENNICIEHSVTDLASIDVARAMNNDFDNTDRRVRASGFNMLPCSTINRTDSCRFHRGAGPLLGSWMHHGLNTLVHHLPISRGCFGYDREVVSCLGYKNRHSRIRQ